MCDSPLILSEVLLRIYRCICCYIRFGLKNFSLLYNAVGFSDTKRDSLSPLFIEAGFFICAIVCIVR
jgi:hypothetical protein